MEGRTDKEPSRLIRILDSLRSPVLLIVALVTLLVVCLVLLRLPFTEFIELKLYDSKFRYRGLQPASQELAIVAIDDASVQQLGRWPWPREVFSRFLERLKKAEPRVIGLDIIFAEKEESAAVISLKRLRQKMSQRNLARPEILDLLQAEEKEVDVDRLLAEEISRGTPTVLGFYFKEVGSQIVSPEADQLLGPGIIQVSTFNLVRHLDEKKERLPIIGAQGVEVNLPAISAAADGGGYFNIIPDADGSVRWLPLAVAHGPDIFAPLSLITLQHYLGKPPLGITLSHRGVREIRLGRQLIPVDRYGRFFINYLGPSGAFTQYSAADVWEGRLPEGALKDKLVLVGATATGIYDLRVTPFSGICPGIEIEATLCDNVLRNNYLRLLPYAPVPTLLIVVFLGIFLGVMLPRFSAAWAFVLTLYLLIGYVIVNYLLFRYSGVILELFYPLLQVVLVSTGVTMQRFLAEERARVRLKKAFQSYVAPTVVEEIIKNPDRLRLGGERRELTIFFCDIRNFTTMAETLDPEALVHVLHDFLNPMSEIIVKHGGTLDKYMGDAIMALYGAPVDYPDHARRACDTALEMLAALKELDREWMAQGRPSLRIGVGINTGPVAVGNMGSDRLFDYTAIGDNVNLTARLEGLNKFYGTDILISAATAKSLDHQFTLREVDLVKVKGKRQPIAIYELLGKGPPDPELARFLELYHQGLKLFRERQWEESLAALEAARELHPQDGHLARYLDLAKKFKQRPPAPEWDGVAVMERK